MASNQPRKVALTGALARTTPRSLLGHFLAGVASWFALCGLWIWQLETFVPANWPAAIGTIFLILMGWVGFSLAWVAWARSIYRRRHNRTTPIVRHVGFDRDLLGRKVVAPPGMPEARGQILVSVEEPGLKRYQLAERAPARWRPEAEALERRHRERRIAK